MSQKLDHQDVDATKWAMPPVARPTERYRPAWRTPVGNIRTEKRPGDVEMHARGFHIHGERS